jgi:hypothetical protein
MVSTMREAVRRAEPSPVVADAILGACVAVGLLAAAFAGAGPAAVTGSRPLDAGAVALAATIAAAVVVRRRYPIAALVVLNAPESPARHGRDPRDPRARSGDRAHPRAHRRRRSPPVPRTDRPADRPTHQPNHHPTTQHLRPGPNSPQGGHRLVQGVLVAAEQPVVDTLLLHCMSPGRGRRCGRPRATCVSAGPTPPTRRSTPRPARRGSGTSPIQRGGRLVSIRPLLAGTSPRARLAPGRARRGSLSDDLTRRPRPQLSGQLL